MNILSDIIIDDETFATIHNINGENVLFIYEFKQNGADEIKEYFADYHTKVKNVQDVANKINEWKEKRCV